MYFLFFQQAMVSSRMSLHFKMLEIVIFPYLAKFKSKYRKFLIIYVLILCVLSYLHSMEMAFAGGGYRKGTNAINFPYISILNKEDWRNAVDVHYLANGQQE